MGLMEKESILTNNYDGVIGLAYPSMASFGLPIFDSMM
jgi:hypothetical protein